MKSVFAYLEPLGLEYVGGVLLSIEKEYEIYDEFEHSVIFRKRRLRKKIRNYSPDVVGFTANANTVDDIILSAKMIKTLNPSIIIIVGGPQAELNYSEFFVDCIDYIFHDSGLESFKEAAISDFDHGTVRTLRGVCFKEKAVKCPTTTTIKTEKYPGWVTNEKSSPISEFITMPDRTPFYNNLHKINLFLKGRYALVKASFACPYQCSFCYCSRMNCGTYSERSIDSVMNELKGINHDKIWFVDDSFLLSRKRVMEFIDKLNENDIKKEFMVYSRTDFIVENADLLPALYDAGFRDIIVGLEACDDDFLEAYKKQTKEDINTQAIKLLHYNNLICNGLFIVDYRFSKVDFKILYKYIVKQKLFWALFAIFTPLKGTPLYEEYRDKLNTYKSKKLDFLHLTLNPTQMSKFMFYIRFYRLHIKVLRRLLAHLIFKRGMN